MVEAFTPGFIEHFKIIITAVLVYAIIFALLKKLEIFGDSPKVNAVIALASAIIVSTTGVAAYSISYAINWFVIIFMVIFLLIVLLLFLGMDFGTITEATKNNSKIIVIAFLILFGIVVVKGFFALNNAFDTSNPQNDSYKVDTSANTGVDDITGESGTGWFSSFNIDSELLSAVAFLLILAGLVLFLGR